MIEIAPEDLSEQEEARSTVGDLGEVVSLGHRA